MWNLTKFNGEEIAWYSEEEYREVEQNLDKAEKILYNIDTILKDESISDDGALLLIRRELVKWNV